MRQKAELLVPGAGLTLVAGGGRQVKFRAHIFRPNEQIPPLSPPLSFTPLSRFMKHDNNIRHSTHCIHIHSIIHGSHTKMPHEIHNLFNKILIGSFTAILSLKTPECNPGQNLQCRCLALRVYSGAGEQSFFSTFFCHVSPIFNSKPNIWWAMSLVL